MMWLDEEEMVVLGHKLRSNKDVRRYLRKSKDQKCSLFFSDDSSLGGHLNEIESVTTLYVHAFLGVPRCVSSFFFSIFEW
jgi:hypothetical protein